MKIKVVGISILFSVLMVSCNGASEEIIIKTIKTLKKKMTIIVISHRKKLFAACDNIIDLK